MLYKISNYLVKADQNHNTATTRYNYQGHRATSTHFPPDYQSIECLPVQF